MADMAGGWIGGSIYISDFSVGREDNIMSTHLVDLSPGIAESFQWAETSGSSFCPGGLPSSGSCDQVKYHTSDNNRLVISSGIFVQVVHQDFALDLK